MSFLRSHSAVVVALIALAAAGYMIFDLVLAPGTDFDPVMR